MMSAVAMMSSSLFTNSSPMLLLLIIIANSMFVACLTFQAAMEMWTSILLVMVYVSGVMVLFMYIVSLTSNSKTKKSNPHLMTSLLWVGLMVSLMDPYNSSKATNKFSYSMEKFISMIIIVSSMLLIMATIIPKLTMASFKGMKSSK